MNNNRLGNKPVLQARYSHVGLLRCSGRSEEAAEVIFERREDALSALKKYNNLSLDGKPMKIELIEAAAGAPGAGRMLSSGIR